MIAVPLDERSSIPLYKQLYEGIRALILKGDLAPGQTLPSTRELCALLSISRTTATLAYEVLTSEGYIASTAASRTYVRKELPEHFLQTTSSNSHPSSASIFHATNNALSKRHLSDFGNELLIRSRKAQEITSSCNLVDISSNAPSVRDFPMKEWKRTIDATLMSGAGTLYEYATSDGCVDLRTALAEYLRLSRGVHCHWQQLIVTFGSKQALDLIARVHLDPNDRVAMEDPGYPSACAAFRSRRSHIHKLKVDHNGLDPHSLTRLKSSIKLVYTTPSHQFPVGGIMPLERRMLLLQQCARLDALVVEDDYDSEFRYSGHPLSALQGLSEECRVIYVGTLSKLMFPSLRIGYIVVPPALIETYQEAQAAIYGHPPTLLQAATANFMQSGALNKHIRKMRLLYSERRELAITLLEKSLGSEIEIMGDASGLHFVIRFPPTLNANQLVQKCKSKGFLLKSISNCYLNANPDTKSAMQSKSCTDFMFGFGRLNQEELTLSIKALRQSYTQCK